MGWAIPVGFIIYIVLAILGAVIKGVQEQSKRGVDPRGPGREIPLPDVFIPEKVTETDSVELIETQQAESGEDWQSEASFQRESSKETVITPWQWAGEGEASDSEAEDDHSLGDAADEDVHAEKLGNQAPSELSGREQKREKTLFRDKINLPKNQHQLREALIWAELFREPRSKRPWPQR